LFQKQTGLSDITVRSWTPFLQLSATQHALLIFGLSAFILLLPKILALVDLVLDRERARLFGGAWKASLSAFLELLYSTLQAPILMLWHTQFVASTLIGRSVSWGNQNRGSDGTAWGSAWREHWKHVLVGVVWGAMIWRIDPALMGWFAPVLLGMLLSPVITVLTSRRRAGEGARTRGLFLTPEETEPSGEICELRVALARAADGDTKATVEGQGLPSLENVRQTFSKKGAGPLNPKELLLLLSDFDSVRQLGRPT
jgi:membrane glycosyltransferase